MTRRELLGGIVKGSMIAILSDVSNVFEGGNLMAQEIEKKTLSPAQLPPAYTGGNEVKPLPFPLIRLVQASSNLLRKP